MLIPLYLLRLLVTVQSKSGVGHEDQESRDLKVDYFYMQNESEAAAMMASSATSALGPLRSGRRPRSAATSLPVAPDVDLTDDDDSSNVSALRPGSADRI